MMRLALVLVLSFHVLAAGRDLAPRPLGPSAHYATSPMVAFAGGKFLTVWTEHANGTTRVAGTFSDARGRRLSQRSFVVGVEVSAVHLVATSDSFALFTVTRNGMQLVDIDAAGRVSLPRDVDIVRRGELDITWNGTHFLATSSAWISRGAQLAVLLDREGTIVRSRIPLTAGTTSSSLAPFGDSFVRVAVRDSALFAERIANDGSVQRYDLDTGAVNAVTGRCGSDCVALSWISNDGSIRAATLDNDGSLSPVETFALPDAPDDAIFRLLHVLKTSDGFTLVLRESSMSTLHIVTRIARHAVASAFFAAASSDEAILVANATSAGVQGFAIDRSGSIRTETLAIDKPRQTQPILGAGGGTALAAFTEWVGETPRVRVTMIDADGTPLEHRIVAENARLASRDVAWNGSEFLTVVSRAGKLRALHLDANGERIEANLPLLGNERINPVTASVAWAGDRWLVLWPAGEQLLLATLTPNAIVSSVRALSLPERIATNAAIAFDGAEGIVAWIERPCEFTCYGTTSAFSMRIRRDVTALDGIAEPLEGAQFLHNVSVAAGGGEFVAVTNADVTFDGREFVIATRYGGELAVHRHGSARRTTAQSSDGNEPPSIAAILGNVLVGVQESDPIDGGRATLYMEREMTYFFDQHHCCASSPSPSTRAQSLLSSSQ